MIVRSIQIDTHPGKVDRFTRSLHATRSSSEHLLRLNYLGMAGKSYGKSFSYQIKKIRRPHKANITLYFNQP
jgi:hypothetical protein